MHKGKTNSPLVVLGTRSFPSSLHTPPPPFQPPGSDAGYTASPPPPFRRCRSLQFHPSHRRLDSSRQQHQFHCSSHLLR
ncbi:hypothetical protein L2E82_15474 [Cichorium intybus]|uniref:Uncharacterized protein n=1 Tax=Cichorium intybus TaxID=13427 RepID=A0ACB9F3B3_CICIN|nr:hypothetical protein L2E82_15474 [Cichorium intybus]